MKKYLLILFASFCVYCGYQFAERKYLKQIEVIQFEATQVSKSKSALIMKHSRHLDRCRFNHYSK